MKLFIQFTPAAAREPDRLGRISDDNAIRGDIPGDNTARADKTVLTDRDPAKDRGITA